MTENINITEKITKASRKAYDLSDDDESDEELKIYHKSKQTKEPDSTEEVEGFFDCIPEEVILKIMTSSGMFPNYSLGFVLMLLWLN